MKLLLSDRELAEPVELDLSEYKVRKKKKSKPAEQTEKTVLPWEKPGYVKPLKPPGKQNGN